MSYKHLGHLIYAVWVVATLEHATLLWRAAPDSMFLHAILIAVTISFRSGRIRWVDERVVWVKPPDRLVVVLVILVSATFYSELSTDFSKKNVTIGSYLYENLGFWALLSMNATDISQVAIPMWMMVRPLQAMLGILFVALGQML